MDKHKRHDQLIKYIKDNPMCTVNDICRDFSISKNNIRVALKKVMAIDERVCRKKIPRKGYKNYGNAFKGYYIK